MTVRLIALDLDGTLLSPSGEIDPPAAAALAAARARGISTVLVTGRTWAATRRFVTELDLTLPAICLAGALVVDVGGSVLSRQPMDLADARAAAGVADARQVNLVAYLGESGEVRHVSRIAPDFQPGGAFRRREPPPTVGDITPYLTEAPLQLVATGQQAVNTLLSRHYPASQFLLYDLGTPIARAHMLHRAATKGDALVRLCRELGIDPGEVFAMGDQLPDLSMLAVVGHPAAMPAAPAALKKAAAFVPDPDDPSPVASALQRLVLGT